MSGGSESSTHDLCCELLKCDCEVAVVSSIENKGFIYYRNRVLSKLKKSHFIYDSALGYPVYRGWNFNDGLQEVIGDFKPDVAVVQAGNPFKLVNLISGLNLPVVLYMRDIEFHLNSEELNINANVGFIANSNFTARRFNELYQVDSCVIPPLIKPDNYIVKNRGDAVLHIGLHQRKGIDISFELAKRRPDIPFVFVESWPLSQKEYLNYQKRAAVLRNVILYRRSSDMKKYYRMAKLLLVPSCGEEAWGRVVTEAQLSGIPVIASNRGGLPESVGLGGSIVPYDSSIDEWEKSLSSILNDEGRYLQVSEAALERSKDVKISKEYLLDRFVTYLSNHIQSTKVG